MSKKIYISPSDQTKNTYAAGNTNEAIQCRKIATSLVAALQRCGFEAKTNLTASMADRVREGNAWVADLYVAVHTNAFNEEVAGTRIFAYALTGEGYNAAKAVFDALAPITPGTSENIKARPELYEVRNSKAPCVYVEADFHDVDAVALWIIENTAQIAEAIAKGICNYFGVKYVAAGSNASRYKTIDDVPKELRAETNELIASGAFKGKGGDAGLDVTEDMLRCMIINMRYTKKAIAESKENK